MSLESTIADLVTSTNELTNQVMALLGGGIGARKIIYCSPGGSGSGETPASPCTLQCALDTIITDGAVNEVNGQQQSIGEEGLLRLAEQTHLPQGKMGLLQLEEALRQYCGELHLSDDLTLVSLFRSVSTNIES